MGTSVLAVTGALRRTWRRSPVRVAACPGVRVRTWEDAADVAVELCLDTAAVTAADRLRAAVAITARVDGCIESVLEESGWRRRTVDVTVRSLGTTDSPHRRTPTRP